ncbi:MAG TPA: FAD-binding and (Fe-S)-binding domain-containing protein [Actinotalea caeni]|uniref:FAD-binding and (Fe-S)-binding domain-containing protein n=1 Tax=Actinotalea caeni TaxID=1348467 RepID=UPI002B4B9314|nr:FAD-binding and (Fe-S)-binding domain-containing protein [Actinotalea caeni]HLV54457.1 FAD-binding and (Fe-S)-binding domain-containing protein [Actinotalea caeni]
MPDLLADLRAAVSGDVDASARRRAEYSTDASNYRVVPEVVVFPRSTDDVLAALEVARSHGSPVTARGGGTSVAGNAVGPGVVLDFSRHLDKVLEIDPEARTARVQPGTVMSTLQAAAKPHGLRFGPDPSTQNRCTIAGMIGNNACGPHAVAYGRTADNTAALDVVDGTGRRFTAGRGDLAAVPGLEELVAGNLSTIRTEMGRFGRQVSGYSLEHLLPENGRDLAKFLVGTEGTLVTVLEATVDLVPIPGSPTIVALGYPDMPSAADAVPAMLAHRPLAVEGLDDRLLDVVRRHSTAPIPDLPEGAGWLLVEVGGATQEEAFANAQALAADAGTRAVRILPAGPEASRIWQIRADGAGLAGRTPSGAQAWPGWEDAAVPPERLGAYLRDFNALLDRYGVDGLPYGHFGDGCIHVRIDLPLDRPGGSTVFRDFMHDAAALVASHGGSLSGEHGDGRARGELLPYIYSPEAIGLMEQVKGLLDPEDRLNPGVVVRPRGVAQDLRRPHARPLPVVPGGFSFAHDGGDLTTAVHRCVGVGKCRADTSAAGGFMCPSYLATRDEKDSTRGRARVLQELANGSLVRGWDAPEVEESLDLCLSCKACGSDCPAGVDMATYKAEVTHRRYRGRLRPVSHYALGWLPRWSRLVTSVPGLAALANAALGVAPVRKAVLAGGGMDTRRGVPRFATTRFTRWFRDRARRGTPSGGEREVLLWVDSFSETLSTAGAQAMVRLLTDAGYTVRLPDQQACCGLTWISTGQLDGARARLRQTLDVLSPWVERGVPIVGIEPSCTAVLRSDLLELLGDDPRSQRLARGVHTLAELLTAPAPLGPGEDWQPPDLAGLEVVAQPHCHQHAVMGYGPDLALLERAGATVRTIAGCCGLAGNFGMEKGHYDVSVAVAENGILPALREAPEGAVLLADGFSCRTQADQLAGVTGVTLAELLTRGARERVT